MACLNWLAATCAVYDNSATQPILGREEHETASARPYEGVELNPPRNW